MYKFIFIIPLLIALQACSAIYREDYFSPSFESAAQFDEYCHFYMGGGMAGIESKFSGPDRIARIEQDDSILSFCSTTTENMQTLTVGPLFLAVIPMPVSSEGDKSTLTIAVKHESKSDKFSIDISKPYLLNKSGQKLTALTHENKEYLCYGGIMSRDKTEENQSIKCNVYLFNFKKNDLIESQYTFHLTGATLNNKPLLDMKILFNRERATFFIMTGEKPNKSSNLTILYAASFHSALYKMAS